MQPIGDEEKDVNINQNENDYGNADDIPEYNEEDKLIWIVYIKIH